MTYKLSSTLSGHDQDVKSLVSTIIHESPALVSVSRDSTTRTWKQPNTSTKTASEIVFVSPTKSFLNSVAVISLPQHQNHQFIASGGQDAMIYLTDLSELEPHGLDQDAKFQLIGHEGNVCSMHFAHGELVSSSWDTTAIVWDLEQFTPKYVLKGHESSVWDCKVLNSNQFLTASADRTIRLWNAEHEVLKYIGHTDVVRKLLVLPNGKEFVSCSNDGTIRIWNLQTGVNVKTLYGHDSFVYDLELLPNGNLVSTGEDRTVRIWDLGGGNNDALQVITLPCISVWTVATLSNGDFAVGGSDNEIRVFTLNDERTATEDEVSEFAKAVQSASISEQSLDDLKKTDIPGIEALSRPGKKEGSTIMVKTPEGMIEAHQWSGGQWHKIGDVVGGASNSASKKEYQGKQYDYVFDVDIKDGEPPLKLPYNLNQNPYVVAEKFLSDNELPATYTEEVVRFLETNTAGASLNESSVVHNNNQPGNGSGNESELIGQQYLNDPYSDAYNRKHKQTKSPEKIALTSIVPVKTYINFIDFKKETLVNGLKKLNLAQESHKLGEEEICNIERILAGNFTSADAVTIVTKYSKYIIENWKPSSVLIAFDLLRVALSRITTVDLLKSTAVASDFYSELSRGLDIVDSSNPALLMMIVKVLSNIVGDTLFLQLFIDPVGNSEFEYNPIFKECLSRILTQFAKIDTGHKLYSSLLIAVASFIFDLSVYQIKTPGLLKFKGDDKDSRMVSGFTDETINKIVESSSEAAYRLLVAYGNFKFAASGTASSIKTPLPEWVEHAVKIYSSKNEVRFEELAKDIKAL